MATTTVTATSIELGSLAAAGPNITQRDTAVSPLPVAAAADEDPAMAASRLADSSVPDGGYGWVAVSGCAVLTWWFVGTSYSWGVIQGALVERGLSSPATLSFVGSLSVAIISVLATINGRVVRLLGARRTAMLGISLLSLAEVLSSFAVTNLAGLFITSGVVLGVGMR